MDPAAFPPRLRLAGHRRDPDGRFHREPTGEEKRDQWQIERSEGDEGHVCGNEAQHARRRSGRERQPSPSGSEAEQREVRPGVERQAQGGASSQRHGRADGQERERLLGDPAHGPHKRDRYQRRQYPHAAPPPGRTRRPVCPAIPRSCAISGWRRQDALLPILDAAESQEFGEGQIHLFDGSISASVRGSNSDGAHPEKVSLATRAAGSIP
jgi:hypothetical protein